MNTTSTKPRCSKCGSVHLEEYNPIEDIENATAPPIKEETFPTITQKDFSGQMNARILEHFDKMSSIQLLNAMSQGIVTRSPEVTKQENAMSKEIIDSLKTSNETLVDSLADKTEQEQQTQQEQKPDEMSQIMEFAKNNPEIVKQVLGNLDKKE